MEDRKSNLIQCTFPDGGKTILRHVSVGSIVLNQDKTKILLVKRSPDSFTAPNAYDMPGGYMNLDETTRETAVREIQEETGLEAKIIALFCINDVPTATEERQNIEFIYLAEADEVTGEHDSEVSGMQWFALSELPPPEEFAFNRRQDIDLYSTYQKSAFVLPFVRGEHL